MNHLLLSQTRRQSILFSLLIIILTLPMYACVKKDLFKEKNQLKNIEYEAEETIQFAQWINLSADKQLNRFTQILPQFLKEKFKNVKKIHFASKHKVIKNVDEIIKEYQKKVKPKEITYLKRYIQSFLKDNPNSLNVNFYTDSKQSAKKKESKQSKKHLRQVKKMNEIVSNIRQKTDELNIINHYEQYYQQNRIPFPYSLGIHLTENPASKIKVVKTLLKPSTKNIFNLKKSINNLLQASGDWIILGTLKKKSDQVKIELRVFDKYQGLFVLEKKLQFPMIDLLLKLETVSDRIVNELKQMFSLLSTGTLHIQTEPKDALILLDKQKKGYSNFESEHPSGFYSLEVMKKGYKKIKGEVFVAEGKTTDVMVKLEETKESGKLQITSNPPGADIFLDLDYLGTAPIFIQNALTEEYKIRAEKKGFKNAYAQTKILKDKVMSLQINLEEGNSKYESIFDTSKWLNQFKNGFLYSSFVSFGGMLYGFLTTTKYNSLLKEKRKESIDNDEFLYLKSELDQSTVFRNAMIGSTAGLIFLTVLFQILELNAEDIEVGFMPKEDVKDKLETIEKTSFIPIVNPFQSVWYIKFKWQF